jgi:hypothetical protein
MSIFAFPKNKCAVFEFYLFVPEHIFTNISKSPKQKRLCVINRIDAGPAFPQFYECNVYNLFTEIYIKPVFEFAMDA